MTWLGLIIVVSILALGLTFVLVQLAGLPGTWLLVLAAVSVRVFEVFHPLTEPDVGGVVLPIWGWPTFATLVGLAVAAEAVEFGASAAGAKVGGASRRGMIGALVGGLVGVLVGTVAIPIPVVGSILGAVAGSAVGAIVGELSEGGRTLGSAALPAAGAAAGRIAGSLLKAVFAAAMWLWMAIAAFV